MTAQPRFHIRTGTAHLTRDPELVTTSGGTEICLMRIAVKRAARDGAAGYFDLKAFEGQARACAEYLSAGREVALEGRLRFEEFETRGGDSASRVYIVADAVEFLASRRRDGSQSDDGQEPIKRAEPAQVAGQDDGERPTASSRPGPRPPRPRAGGGSRQDMRAMRNPQTLDALSFSGCFAYVAHRDKLLAAADRDLTGHVWHPSAGPCERHYPGGRRILFAREADVHAGILEARRVAGYPPGHPSCH